MAVAIIGRKVGMTQIFDGMGNVIPVTVVQAGPCRVLKHKTQDGKDGYNAVVLGFENAKEKRLTKPVLGQFKALGSNPFRVVKEIRVKPEEFENYPVGQDVTVKLFNRNEKVDVIGWSKGRGFQGVVKRHGFAGAPKTRGTHEYRRHSGSIGMCEKPGHVLKGKRMAGHMGNERVTVLNLKVAAVLPSQNLILIKGAVPGAKNGLVIIRKAAKVPRKKVRGFAVLEQKKA